MTFHFHNTAHLVGSGNRFLRVEAPGLTPMRITFEEPAVHVEVHFRNPSGRPITLRAYSNDQLVAESSTLLDGGGFNLIRLSGPYITQVVFPLHFAELHGICVQTEAEACKENWGDAPVVKLPLVRSVSEALERLESPLHNRYATSRERATERYSGKLPRLLEWLQILQRPGDSRFANPGAQPDQLRLVLAASPHPLREIQPQSILLLAALDPNIARFLSLYWVDADDRSGGPKSGRSYDYKIVGEWADRELCGLLLNVGANETGLPQVQGEVVGKQLPGIRWRGRDPLGRVGIHWKRPQRGLNGLSAVQPVLFDIYRQGTETGAQRRFLTENAPVLVPESSWNKEGSALYIDTNIPLGAYKYEVCGIDLFGQLSLPIDSDTILVEDLEAPPPPVRLHAVLAQPGYPWLDSEQRGRAGQPASVKLSFEYGEMQHRQAPDAERFHLHWRTDSLFEAVPITLSVISASEDESSQLTYIVQATPSDNAGNSDLSTFVGGFLTNVLPGEADLPIARRRRYRIEQVDAGNQLRLAPTTAAIPAGAQWRVISDPHVIQGWSELETISVRRPITGILLADADDGRDFPVTAMGVDQRKHKPNPLDMLPAGRQPAPASAPLEPVEVLLDHALYEPDLFTGGTAEISSQRFPILYSTTGESYDDDARPDNGNTARVGLPPGTAVSAGDTVILRAAETIRSQVEMGTHDGDNAGRLVLSTDPDLWDPGYLVGGFVRVVNAGVTEDLIYTYDVLKAWLESERLHLEIRVQRPAPPPEQLIAQTVEVIPPQVRHLTIAGSVDEAAKKAPGGEIAFDIREGGKTATHTARVVSQVDQRTGHFKLLVRFSSPLSLNLAALRRNQGKCRYYPRYVITRQVMVREPAGTPSGPAPVRLLIPPEQGKRQAYFALSTEDTRGRMGPLSVPTQVTVVRPPPSGAPSAPFPCRQDSASAGYATPPDRQGRATVCLEWTAGTLGATEGLRFEVARVLDNTIIATDRRNWLLGLSDAGLEPVPLEINVVQGLSETAAKVTATLDAARSAYAMDELIGGLLWQTDRVFPVLNAPAPAGSNWVFQVLTENSGSPEPGSARLYPLPILPGLRLIGTLMRDPVPQPNGTLRAEVNVASGAPVEINKLRGGRLAKPLPEPRSPEEPHFATFQITGAEKRDDTLILLLRTMQQMIPGTQEAERYRLRQNDECTVETSPDYSRIVDQDQKLRQLVQKPENEEAFDLVTGMPVSKSWFRDEIPGIGRNRFFYRVRAVDGAENRSDWSPVSVAFWQIDLSPADIPEVVQVRRDTTATTVTLTRPIGPGVRGVRLLRAAVGSTFTEVATFTFDPRDGEVPLTPALLCPAGRLVDLRHVLHEARTKLGSEPELLGIYDAMLDRHSPLVGSNLLTDDARRVRDIVELPSAPPADRPLMAQIQSNDVVHWLSHIEAWVQVTVDTAGAEGDLFVQTVKETFYHGRMIQLDSELVQLKGAP